MTPNAVLFDIGNVILRSTHQITFAAFWDLGVRPDMAARFFHGQHYGDFARDRIDGASFAARTRDALEAPHLTDDEIRAAHNAHIYAEDTHVTQLLDEIRKRHVPIGFVTTTNIWQTERELEIVSLAEHLGPVVRSFEIRMTKTDEGAWPVILHALEWQDRDPATILLVDDAKGNCDAAARAGLRIHQYDPTPVLGVENLRTALREHGVLP